MKTQQVGIATALDLAHPLSGPADFRASPSTAPAPLDIMVPSRPGRRPTAVEPCYPLRDGAATIEQRLRSAEGKSAWQAICEAAYGSAAWNKTWQPALESVTANGDGSFTVSLQLRRFMTTEVKNRRTVQIDGTLTPIAGHQAPATSARQLRAWLQRNWGSPALDDLIRACAFTTRPSKTNVLSLKTVRGNGDGTFDATFQLVNFRTHRAVEERVLTLDGLGQLAVRPASKVKRVGPGNNGDTVRLTRGTSLVLELPYPIGAGLTWRFTALSRSLGKPTVKRLLPEILPGGGGSALMRFTWDTREASAGTHQIALALSRTATQSPARTFAIKARVLST